MTGFDTWGRLVTAVLLTAVLGGCGKELLAGGQRGEVGAAATDDPNSAAAGSRALEPGSRAESTTGAATLELQVEVALVDEAGRSVPLTGGPVTARLRAGTADTVALGAGRLPVGDYPTVRLVFSQVTVDGEPLSIGGFPVAGTVRVDLSAGPLVVERGATVSVREDERRLVVLNLASGAWIQAADPTTLLVPAVAFASALHVSVF